MFIRFDVIHERDGQTDGRTLHTSCLISLTLDGHDLKRRLIAEWSGLQQSIVDDAVDQWRKVPQTSALLRGNERPSLRTFAVGLTLQLELV